MHLYDLLWQRLETFFENNLISSAITPQTVFLGLWSDNANHDEPIINHFLQIIKLYVYNSSEKTSFKHNELTDPHQRNKKRHNTVLSSNSEKK